jgi:outer membrane protein assembly factor BamA
MRFALPFALATATGLAAAPAALAATTYTLDKIEINGVKSVPADQLRAGLKDQPGARVSTNDLLADQDALTKELETDHVVGGVKTSLRNKNNGHIDLIFDVDDQGIQTPKVTTVAPKLGTETFVGNVKLSNDDLTAAAGLQPGDELSDAKIQAARDAIGAAYKKANVGVQLAGAVKQDGAKVDLIWTITEQKGKKKKRNTEDPGGMPTEAQ